MLYLGSFTHPRGSNPDLMTARIAFRYESLEPHLAGAALHPIGRRAECLVDLRKLAPKLDDVAVAVFPIVEDVEILLDLFERRNGQLRQCLSLAGAVISALHVSAASPSRNRKASDVCRLRPPPARGGRSIGPAGRGREADAGGARVAGRTPDAAGPPAAAARMVRRARFRYTLRREPPCSAT